jgi:tetratricopeptide (TPR) repeat protein
VNYKPRKKVIKKETLPEEVEEQLQDILSYLEEGEYEDAVDIVEALAEEFPESYEVILHKVHVYRSLGLHSDEVLPLIEECHAADPSDLDVWVMLVEELAELGFLGLAEMELELIKSSTTDLKEEVCSEEFISSIREASALEKSEYFGDAPDASRLYIAYNLADKSLYFKDFSQASRYTTELIEQAPTAAQSWLIYARFNFQSGNMKEAIRASKKAIEIAPDNGESYYIQSFSEQVLGTKLTIYPELGTTLLDIGISYQAYHLIFTDQIEALIALYENEKDLASSHPDGMRFFECLAFIFYQKGDFEKATTCWQHANALEPDGSLLSELHLKDLQEEQDDSNIPYILFGPSEFPAFFSQLIERNMDEVGEDALSTLTQEQLEVIPNLYSTVLMYADMGMVKLSTQLLISHFETLEDKATILESMLTFAKGKRLSGKTRAFVSHLISLLGTTTLDAIFYRGRYVPFQNLTLDYVPLNVFEEGTDEYFYFEIILENIREGSLSEIEEVCKGIIEKTENHPAFGVEYARILLTLGKFDTAEKVIRELKKNNPDNISISLLLSEIELPANLTDAKMLLEKVEQKKSISPVEFREYQFLKSSVHLYEESIEEALLALDSFELTFPELAELSTHKREAILAKKKSEGKASANM